MIKPWDIKKSDIRKADSTPTFIIFCEDKVSEPVYLKFFETSKIKINFVKEQRSMMANVLNAVTHCRENDLIECLDGKDKLIANNKQVWCVFDRDKEETPAKIRKGNTDFDLSITTAESIGIKVAWSNDAFELWILLHFEDIDNSKVINIERKTYYDRLTEIFDELDNPIEDLVKVKMYPKWNYKESLKSENNFRNIVRNEIVSNTKIAIERSKALEEYFEKLNIQDHAKAPCTLMHHLIEELLKLGGKEI
jgi:hypothetical protein